MPATIPGSSPGTGMTPERRCDFMVWLPRPPHQRHRIGDDLAETRSGVEACEHGGIEPHRLGKLLAERRLARDPPCRERQDDEMPFDPTIAIPCDGFAIAGERHPLHDKPRLLTDFAA